MIAEYLTVGEVSEYLKLPEETVYKYARMGRMPASKVGRYWRFERSRIDAWVDSRSNQARDPAKIFVVDDDPAIRKLFAGWLADSGYSVSVFAGGDEALETLRSADCDLVFLDLLMPQPGGVETLRQIRQILPSLDVVIVTAYFDTRLMDEALAIGPLTVLKKPVEKAALLSAAAGVAAKGMRTVSTP